ncbi:MAG: hypothetical protein QQM50_02215 [Dehalococcoides mccartyi]|uniref:hypothetical protein n=1 Tax=Dehalococcoides TaxID=61434 RepID=UPI002737845B|nr:hypothetical protein [Dehalococcoides mccartyi]MDP4279350.1 hypothetical protein [Dehalococcoides mccartyi]
MHDTTFVKAGKVFFGVVEKLLMGIASAFNVPIEKGICDALQEPWVSIHSFYEVKAIFLSLTNSKGFDFLINTLFKLKTYVRYDIQNIVLIDRVMLRIPHIPSH